jgi:general stress protein YciG
MAEERKGKRRGFAAMDADRQREIASKGGKAAHDKGTAHRFTADEAREAGRKGGEAVSRNRKHMAEIGREGGRKSPADRQEKESRIEKQEESNAIESGP